MANRRPYPRLDRARRQIERVARLRPCPMCQHPEREHAVEGEHRVCSRGEGVRISCRVCAEFWARMPVVAAFTEFARVLSTPPRPSSFVLS